MKLADPSSFGMRRLVSTHVLVSGHGTSHSGNVSNSIIAAAKRGGVLVNIGSRESIDRDIAKRPGTA